MIPQIVVAHPSLPANNVQELIAYGKANPGKLNFASVGIGSPGHIAGELFKLRTGARHGARAVQGRRPGRRRHRRRPGAAALFVSMPAAWQFVKSGKLKALGVTSDKRSIAAPDVADDHGSRRRGLAWSIPGTAHVRAREDAAGRDREAERGDQARRLDARAQGEAAGAGRRAAIAGGVRGARRRSTTSLRDWGKIVRERERSRRE